MTLPAPRTESGRLALASLLAEPADALIAMDYDGTLAPIVDRPEVAVAHPDAAAVLRTLSAKGARVAIVTGRPAADAVRLGGFADVPGLVVLGHYGLERWSDGRLDTPVEHSGVAVARAAGAEIVAHAPAGVALEDKGHSVAFHTRASAAPGAVLAEIRPQLDDLAHDTGLELALGRFVLELRPPGVDKGTSLRRLVADAAARSVTFVGDDLGDLAAVSALRSLDVAGLVVCSDSAESPPLLRSEADLVVDGPDGVVAFLAGVADRMAS
ncbi:MAG TPA: trehalose-phosphatase [Jiangellaceae bacterium]|nr:trehalose-phosphatase [Jiangellaceae bacterium]